MLRKIAETLRGLGSRLGAKSDSDVGSGVRTRGGQMQVPILALRHPATGRNVWLVGMMHIAESSFYRTVNDFLDQHADCAVLYEQVGGKPENESGSAADLDEAKAKFKPLKSFQKSVAEAVGCEFQMDAVPIRKDWINTDISLTELHADFKKAGIDLESGQFAEVEQKTLDPRVLPMLRWSVNSGIRMMGLSAGLMQLLAKGKRLHPIINVIVNKRNRIGFAAIMEYAKSNDVVSIWGAGHLPGLRDLLLAEGYVVASCEWNTAYVPRDYSLFQAIRASRAAAREEE